MKKARAGIPFWLFCFEMHICQSGQMEGWRGMRRPAQRATVERPLPRPVNEQTVFIGHVVGQRVPIPLKSLPKLFKREPRLFEREPKLFKSLPKLFRREHRLFKREHRLPGKVTAVASLTGHSDF